MKTKNKSAWRVFFFSFCWALCFLILTLGMIAVDYQGRKLSFGDDTPPFRVLRQENGESVLEIKLFGGEKQMNFTFFDKIWSFICDFGCIPHN